MALTIPYMVRMQDFPVLHPYIFATMKKIILLILIITLFIGSLNAQLNNDSTLSNHFQLTVISQSHSGFNAPYAGRNSLADSTETGASSITTTLFFGKKLGKNAAFYFDPEVAGGAGLSYSVGVAGALNGETYRIGNPQPKASIARAYYQQNIPLGNTKYDVCEDDVNQVKCSVPCNRITISAGKFAISDFYDKNNYSHDPRDQFFNWSLMSNGAWDYPANTRGYTFGLVVELIKPTWAMRISTVSVPKMANQPDLEYNLKGAHSETFEAEKSWAIHKHAGIIRFLVSNTYSRAPSYLDGINAIKTQDTHLLNVFTGTEESNTFGGRKFGLGLSYNQELTDEIGVFARAGWNDGKHASWAFTEIDQTISGGLSVKGAKWHRPDDVCGIAGVIDGISKDHRDFLAAGGNGFIIGDGALNYGLEKIMETYYDIKLTNTLKLTFDYQFVTYPAYNKDRKGPIHVFGIRGHVEF